MNGGNQPLPPHALSTVAGQNRTESYKPLLLTFFKIENPYIKFTYFLNYWTIKKSFVLVTFINLPTTTTHTHTPVTFIKSMKSKLWNDTRI